VYIDGFGRASIGYILLFVEGVKSRVPVGVWNANPKRHWHLLLRCAHFAVCLKALEWSVRIAGLPLLTITPSGLGLCIKDLYARLFMV
jgi:hypothetical protein